jgi:hypothetical protein
MRFFGTPTWLLVMATVLAPASAKKQFSSSSLNSCQAQSSFQARRFEMVFDGDRGVVDIEIEAISSYQGFVKFDIRGSAYGYEFVQEVVDPCDIDLKGMCPMPAAKINIGFALDDIGAAAADAIPGIAYTVPDLDATLQVFINRSDTGESVACVETDISNGKTVDLLGVKWATAIIAGLGLVSSGIVSALGHSNAAAHVASNSLSLFSYFQSQAILGCTAVSLPPIVQSWTQNFQWSMGIIRVGFMQEIFTWYQRATGGEAASLFKSLEAVSVQVQKRGLMEEQPTLMERGLSLLPRAITSLAKRSGNLENNAGSFLVYGIQRVAYRADIETTNLFLTGLTFFCLFAIFTIIFVAAFKGITELLAKQKIINNDRFLEFRNGWLTILKGILFRVTLIGFPQIVILSLWEFTQVDSPALVVLAVFFLVGMCATLAWGSSKVIRIARRSVAMHRNPAYILFSDPQALNKWGFLYIQYRASAYYFIVPLLLYILIKGMFVGLGQSSGIAQAVGFIIIEAGFLIPGSVLRPWMDKPTNSFNIAIGAISFVNAIFLFIFTNVLGLPPIVVGVVGVVLFVMNAAFALILLLMVLVSAAFILFRKNPDARYQFMADDRASFMKSQSQLNTTTELDALAATARGDKAGYKSHLDLDDDSESLSSEELRRRGEQGHGVFGLSKASQSQRSFHDAPRSPVNPSMPLFPAGRPESPFRSASPATYNPSGASVAPPRQQPASSSPWQRGAGYE